MKKLLIKLRALMLLLLMMVGVSSAWAEEATIVFASGTNGDGNYYFQEITGTIPNVLSFSSAKNSSSTNPAYNSNNSELRLYAHTSSPNNGGSITLTVAENVRITGIEIRTSQTATTKYTIDEGTANSVSYLDKVATVSGLNCKSFKIQNCNATNTQLRIKSITVTYTSASAPMVTLSSNIVDFGTVIKDANIEAKTITATLSNTNFADVELSGAGASAFELDKSSLTETGIITITPNTSVAGSYNAVLTLSAIGANSATATISMTVEVPFSGKVLVMSSSNDANIKFNTGSSAIESAFWANSSPLTYDGITLSGSKGSSNNYSYYDGSVVRFYQNNSFTLTPATDVKISKVEIVRQGTTGSNTGTITCSGLTASSSNTTINTNVFSGLASSAVTFTAEAQARFTEIYVYYYPAANKVLQSVAISGTPTKTTYEAGENFEPAGLTVTGTYDQGDPEVITEGITWSTPAALIAGQTSVDITATVNGITSSSYTVNGLTVNAPVTSVTLSGELTNTTYTIGDAFDHTGLVATANYSDGSQANVTETATWKVDPETLTTAGTVTVTVSASFGGQEDIQEYEVTVNKKAASISFAPATIEVEVNKTAEISAITTPEDAVLSYTITEGGEYISLENGIITGVAEGTATVRADFEGNGEYEPASAELTVNVIPEDTRTVVKKNNFQEGETSGKIDASISYESFKGGSSTAPVVNSNCIRLYQNGGYITITAGSPASLSEVSITTGSTYNSTTIGYVIGKGDAPSTGETVEKETKYTVSDLDCSSISFYCLGTDKNTRLDIAEIEVKYIGVAAPKLDHITLSGTYSTEFNVGDEFSHEGMTVTAHYTDGSDADVTASAEFSGFDLSSAGTQTITVSYTDGDVTKTASYDVTVSVVKQSEIEETTDFPKVYSSLGTDKSEDVEDVVGTSYNITFAKPQSSKTPTKFYQRGDAVRIYEGNTITISAIDPIVKVEVAYVSGYIDEKVSVSAGTATYDSNNVLNWWINDGETKSATLTAGSTSRFTAITVYYQCESRVLAASGYTTIAAPFRCRIEGATAYIASSQNGEAVTLSAIEQSKVVDAGTGLMLKGTSESNAYLVRTTKEADDLGENLLVGVASADHVMASGSNYVLATKNTTGVTAFYKYTGAATALVGKAYLNVPSSSASSLRISFDDLDQDNETGISSIEEKEVETPSFDLLGRKSNASGLLINNGKIIMVK